jgi:hypothetical protein
MIFLKSWNWGSFSTECLLDWLNWHLIIETSSLTVYKRMSASRFFRLWIWRHVRSLHWRCLTSPSDYGNSHASGFKIPNTVISGHSSQHKMNRPLWSMPWRYWVHSNIGPCGCRRGILPHCILLSLYTMRFVIIWMAWCELSLTRRLNERKTCSSPWS